MEIKKRNRAILIFVCLTIAIIVGIILTGNGGGSEESLSEIMRDAVLHEKSKISLFGIKDVNPGLISAYTVTLIIFILSLILRIFVIPKFKMVPGKLQMLIEGIVELFSDMAKSNSPKSYSFLSAYIFTAGVYIFVGTIFELFGVQAITTLGTPITLPAPLSDINGAIALGCFSYIVILVSGIIYNGFGGAGRAIKEFSLPISMSFRLFGALLSGALVTELVYYYSHLSFVLPVIVGFLFTLLHALIQAYVLTMLTSLFYGEVTE